MAKPSPHPPDPESPLQLQARRSVDETIDKFIGSSGRAQIFQAILAATAKLFDAQQCFVSVFADAPASWHCSSDTAAAACRSSASATSPCSLPASSWSWDRPAHASTVSEWSLDCIGSSVKGLPASAFFFGCLFGGLVLATLADSTLGRKKMLFLSCFSMSLAGILTSLAPNVWVYAALRFATGFWRATIGTTALVLSTEIAGKGWRDQVSIAGFFLFTVGYLSLPAMAYLARDWSWRCLYLMTSVPALCYSVLFYFIAKESPRWLLVMGRRDEAVQTFKDIAAWNGDKDALSTIESYEEFDLFEESRFCGAAAGGSSSSCKPKEAAVVGLFSALKMLVERRWSLKRLGAVMTLGFGLGMAYYGMPLGVGDLGFDDLYLSVTFNALAELPSSLLVFFFVKKMSRRRSVFWFTVVSGASSLACVALEGELARMAAEVVAFFSACSALWMLYIYMVELFPTCVRNSAVAMVRQALALAGVIAPVLAAAGTERKGGFLPFGVYGLVIGWCAFFVLSLRETRGEGICDTMEEQEQKDNDHHQAAADLELLIAADGGGNQLKEEGRTCKILIRI